MLHTTNIDSHATFALTTRCGYLIDEGGNVTLEYNVPLQDVVACIDDHAAAMEAIRLCFEAA